LAYAAPPSARAQQAPADSIRPARFRPATVVLPNDSVEVAFEDTGVPVVEVMINGQGPFRFGVETGASVVGVSVDLLGAIANSTDPTGNRMITVDSLRVGAALFTHVPANLLAFGPMEGVQLDGLLGLNAYYDLLMTLDPVRKRVRFTRGSLPAANHRDIFALQPIMNEYYGMALWINGVQTMGLLDTQNAQAFWEPASLAADTQFTRPPVVMGVTQGPTIGGQDNRFGRVKQDVRIAGTTFHQPIAAIFPIAVPHWFIGWPTLRTFTMTVDQRHRRVRLSSSVTDVPAPASLFYAGMDYRGSPKGSTVTSVARGGVAEGVGIVEGDVIVSFDDVSEWTPETFAEFEKRMNAPAPVRLKIRHGTDVRTVELTPRDITPIQ
jgi:hypothetical protein